MTMIAMAYLMIRQVRESGQPPSDEKEVSPEEARQMNELLRSLNIEVREDIPARLPPVESQSKSSRGSTSTVKRLLEEQAKRTQVNRPPPKKKSDNAYTLQSGLTFDSSTKRSASVGKRLINNLPSKKQIVILHDLFGPPKGL